MDNTTTIIAYNGFVKLNNWTESSRAGRKVHFAIPGQGHHPFKRFTSRDGKIAGQRFSVVLTLIDDAATPAWKGEVMLLGWNVSAKEGRTMALLVSDEEDEHPFSLYKSGIDGQHFASAFVELAPDETPILQNAADVASDHSTVDERKAKSVKFDAVKPYAEYAKNLHRANWFINVSVLRAVGCEDDFHAWLCKQPCVFTLTDKQHAVFDPEDSDVEFTKVNGAQEYAAIPICKKCQAWDVVPTSIRNKYAKQWAEEKIAKHLSVESLGFASPDAVVQYAKERNIAETLPMIYRRINT